MADYALVIHLDEETSLYAPVEETDQVQAILAAQKFFKNNPDSNLKKYTLELVRIAEVVDLTPLYDVMEMG